jgi:hypothetical protein
VSSTSLNLCPIFQTDKRRLKQANALLLIHCLLLTLYIPFNANGKARAENRSTSPVTSEQTKPKPEQVSNRGEEKQKQSKVETVSKPQTLKGHNTEKYTASNYKNPVSFEPNKGQTDSRVKFLARGLGYGLFLTANEAVIELNKPVGPDKKDFLRLKNKIPSKIQSSVLRMQFIGTNSRPKISTSNELPGKRNYLLINGK